MFNAGGVTSQLMDLKKINRFNYNARLLIAVSCCMFLTGLNAQTGFLQSREKAGLNKLKDKNWQQAKDLFRSAIQKDSNSILANYGLALYFFTPANPSSQIDSANQYLNKLQKLFAEIDPREADKLKKIPFDDSILNGLRNKIDSAAYISALKKNTLDAFNHYLNMFEKGRYMSTVIYKRDEIAFQNANANNSIESLNAFLESYPTSEFGNAAREKLERLSAEKALTTKSSEALHTFLLNFPNSKFKENIIQVIWEKETADGAPESFRQFINKFPGHQLASRSEAIIRFLNPSAEQRWIPVSISGKFGFADLSGKNVIEGKYDSLTEYMRCQDPASNYFAVPDGVVHKESKNFIPGHFNELTDLSGGYVLLKGDSGNFLYHASGWQPITYPIQQAYNLNHKYLAIKKTNHWQLNALNGATLLASGFDSLSLAANILVLKRNGRYTLVKPSDIEIFNSGKAKIKLADRITELNENHVLLTIGSMSEVIDSEMNSIIKLDRQTVKSTSFGFISEKSKGKYIIGWPGLEDKRFTAVQVADPWMKVKADSTEQLYYIPDHTLFASHADSIWFKDQFTFVRQNDSLKIITAEKKIFRFAATDHVQILSTSAQTTYLLIETSRDLKLYNAATGKLEVSGPYQSLIPVSYTFLIFRKKDKYGIMNFSSKVVVPPLYDAILYKNNWFSLIQKQKFGAYLPVRKKLIKPEYDANLLIQPNGKILARKNNRWGTLNEGVNASRPKFIYDDLKPAGDSLLLAKKDKRWQLLSALDNKLLLDDITDWYQADTPDRIIFKRAGKFGMIEQKRGIIKPAAYQEILWWTEGQTTLFLGIFPFDETLNTCEYFNKSGETVRSFNIEKSRTELIICDN